MTYVSAAMTSDKEYAADCARRAGDFRAKAAKAKDWVERDRLLRVAQGYADDAYFWSRQ